MNTHLGDYPKEYFIPLNGVDTLLGRLTVNHLGNFFHAEIDIVFKESKKIYQHVKILYREESEQDALDNGMQVLSSYLKSGTPSIS